MFLFKIVPVLKWTTSASVYWNLWLHTFILERWTWHWQKLYTVRHILRHKDIRPLNCKICGKTCVSLNYMWTHLSRVCRYSPVFGCRKIVGNLEKHKASCLGIAKRKCPVCSVLLSSAGSMERHMKTHVWGRFPSEMFHAAAWTICPWNHQRVCSKADQKTDSQKVLRARQKCGSAKKIVYRK